MRIRCINRPFRDLAEKEWREVGDEWEATPERLAAINSAGYGAMAEAVEPEPEVEPEQEPEPEKDYSEMTRAQLVEKAEERGIEVPSKATKADIIAMLSEE